ncbi:hypothetical protein C3747_25g167 [Trypanosoma cruzi]|uniref:Autophagy-related protein 101 n=2 Tax=Trypanosoma cruzi TaxID=5693 RepID=Q4DT09_TRYCC|nr:hypothetical protein, conserved [Trypanosoma cruzi]EAN95671.1 hypothetical protein, conserved [Trypanosoma cruzi]KAF5219889.1 hypothetical protein ECC02_007116 [Trypanosoma cruzi]KAF8295968.1 hypothetical protein TcYC6_0088160 [Trypanosoma cruzi]PWV16132.1 hypothetical protein C3747_25g167 [Trypanosoma cruzi]RNC57827.1 hypothetical protein TcCL_ESM04566 [Trypanosoma cruzi]|eukprot:XP_817522.1 hypothetical protein [Trypanosoma cruzi strain CL Brener]
MHTFYTIRYPPPNSQKGGEDSQPIRVTNKAMESLLFCIVHSIEFQSPLQPSRPQLGSSIGSSGKDSITDDEAYVRPVENSSMLLGNVTYVSRSKHKPSVLASLHTAVEAARAIQIPEKSSQVPFELRVRLLRRHRGWLWHDSRPLVEWVFRMAKTREEFSFSTTHGDASERPRPRTSPRATNAHANVVRATGGGGVHSRSREDGLVCSNDPEQIRQVLQFILKHSYDAIDLNTYADFRSGELIFDVSVQEV